MDTFKLLEASQVAAIAGCSRDTVNRDADSGVLPIAARTARGARLFAQDVAALYAERRRSERPRLFGRTA